MGLTRLARASARARLSDTVTVEDVERAMKLEEYCIHNTGYSIDIQTEPMKVEDKLEVFKTKIPVLAEEWGNNVPTRVLFAEAKKVGVPKDDCLNWLRAVDDVGSFVCDPENNTWSLREYGKTEE